MGRVWMFVMLAVAAWSLSTSSAQFLLDVEDDTGHFDVDSPSEVMSCYYCVNVSSNDVCNRWAIERPCPTDHTTCITRHTMDSRGSRTVSITKNCSTEAVCSSQVGCRQDKSTNQTICVSCCETSTFCNEDVAFNSSTAVFYRSGDRTAAFSSSLSCRPCLLLLIPTAVVIPTASTLLLLNLMTVTLPWLHA